MFLLSPTPYEFFYHFPQESFLCMGLLVLLIAGTRKHFSNRGARWALALLAAACALLALYPSPAVHHLVITNTSIS